MSFITTFQLIQAMAIEYNNIYFQINRRPSPKCIMVAIPFYMYRVETNEFEHGLNFFQKLVLKFKAKPGIKDDTISSYTGLDAKLISIVTSELHNKGLINEHGSLNEKGKEKLWEVDGLVVNSGKRKIGYVFKYINQDKLYQYYINQVIPADIIEETKKKHPKIVTGTKGDGDDYTDMPFFLDEAIKDKTNFNRPTEREVLQLIQNSNRKGSHYTDDESKIEKFSSQLSIRFLNDQPEVAWACTYVYIQRNEDNTFEPDWRVLDPFGFGDNVALKFYLSNPVNKNLLDTVQKRFADAKTLGGKILSDYQQHLNKLIEEKLLSDFPIVGFNRLDNNLQLYIKAIIKNLVLLENHKYNDIDASVSFTLNLQNALENILKQDKENRIAFYEFVYSELDKDSSKKREVLIRIYRKRIFSSNTLVPQKLLNVSRGKLEYGKSLLSYLASFIMTYTYDNNSFLFNIFKNRIDIIIEVSQLRNDKGHGQTSSEKYLKSHSKEEVEKFYGFIKSFINDYIKNI